MIVLESRGDQHRKRGNYGDLVVTIKIVDYDGKKRQKT